MKRTNKAFTFSLMAIYTMFLIFIFMVAYFVYDGLKIEIGEAKGQNWWCSLFPPLCFVDISSGVIDEETEKNLKNNLSEEDFAIITSDSETVKLKFKIVEMFSK